MAETDTQRNVMIYLLDVLTTHFKPIKNVYVSGNLMLYYEEGNPKVSLSPDVFVVFDLPNHPRPIYKTWVEGPPHVVFEILSDSTWRKDVQIKPQLFREMGVRELIIFDPLGKIDPCLQGYHLQGPEITPLRVATDTTSGTHLFSLELDLLICLHKNGLRVFDPLSGSFLLSHEEENAARMREREARLKVEEEYKAEKIARLQERVARYEAMRQGRKERKARMLAESETNAERQARMQAESESNLERKARMQAELEWQAEHQARLQLEEENQRLNKLLASIEKKT